jgi:hypothetical protein
VSASSIQGEVVKDRNDSVGRRVGELFMPPRAPGCCGQSPDLQTDAIATRALLLGTISRALIPQAPLQASTTQELGDDARNLDEDPAAGDSRGA